MLMTLSSLIEWGKIMDFNMVIRMTANELLHRSTIQIFHWHMSSYICRRAFDSKMRSSLYVSKDTAFSVSLTFFLYLQLVTCAEQSFHRSTTLLLCSTEVSDLLLAMSRLQNLKTIALRLHNSIVMKIEGMQVSYFMKYKHANKEKTISNRIMLKKRKW